MFDKNCVFWCDCCETVSYRFVCCGNSLCNGGGCPDCIPISQTAYDKLDELEPKINVELLKKSGTLEISE